jgi:hypothetical protein
MLASMSGAAERRDSGMERPLRSDGRIGANPASTRLRSRLAATGAPALARLAAGSTVGSPTARTPRDLGRAMGRGARNCRAGGAGSNHSDGCDVSDPVTRAGCSTGRGATQRVFAVLLSGVGWRTAVLAGLLCRRAGGSRGLALGVRGVGASHLVLRFAGDAERQLGTLANLRERPG